MEIIVENLDYTIHKMNYKPRNILSHLNITFSSGLIHGIIGKSGSGKTVLMELLSFFRTPTTGKVQVTGNTKKLNYIIGFLGEIDKESVDEIVMTKMRNSIFIYKSMSEYDIISRLSDSLRLVGLSSNYLSKKWNCLSEGEKKKILIAITLFHNPKILLLDDPFRNIDIQSKYDLCKLFKMLKNKYRKTIIITSNDVEMLHKIVDKVYVLCNGKLVMSGDKYKVFTDVQRLKNYGVLPPKCILFANEVLEKKHIKIGYRDEVNDVLKDIYRYAKW